MGSISVSSGKTGVQEGQLDGVFIADGPGLEMDDIAFLEDGFQLSHAVPNLAVDLARLVPEAKIGGKAPLFGRRQNFSRQRGRNH